MKEQSWELAQQALAIEGKAILDIASYMDRDAFAEAADILSHCGRVILSGCGGSGVAVKKFSHSLCCIERPAQFLAPGEAVHGGLGCVTKNDAVVLLSRGGKTDELIPIADVAKKKGAKLITVTEKEDSILAEYSDVVLPMRIEREADRFNVMTTTSFIVAAAIFDALLVAIMEETGYRVEQFALIHPGGAVGKRLNP